ncbi:uncharacterized protein LOC100828748 [Brachypodium distachyon]|uniref:Uncharacterized protein n=1 Tax=Brachypodium distachyon TaxID=15368 RepID=I1GXD5_BRADI|nr:uncharacterized protein LOC100828748 [Brachypodium distachyon]KQK17709.1 hypothetical protein BRADI_1g36210v3 [Brachypodium distachyon]|eukprot:XP_010227512.1 uncharacterized protein LOC100828748 [Brachypodium distachyon]
MAAVRSSTRRDPFAAAGEGGGGGGSATRGRASDGSGGGSSLRRSRSLSRFPPPSPSPDDAPTPSSRFVNKVRGGGLAGGFPEISLDDLADEFFRARVESEDDDEEVRSRGEESRGRLRFPATAERGCGGRRSSTARYARETESSRQRERSVSRPPAERRGGAAAAEKGGADVRRQRYASVDRRASIGRQRYTSVDRRGSIDRQRWCDSDNDMDFPHRSGSRGINTKSSSGNSLQHSFNKSTKINQALKRSTSQKDFVHIRDSGSSHSSLTDDESRDTHSFHSRNHNGTRAVYTQEKPIDDEDSNVLYDVMRKEVRQAVEEIRTQLEKAVTKSEPSEKANSDDAQPAEVIGELRRSYTSKLEESEKRKQELLAQLAAEEQRGHQLTKIVKELLPTTKKIVKSERQPQRRRRSNDRARMSKCLTEEAELYFEDFLSNVEDTDFSSFDGERSDTSSTRRDVVLHAMVEAPVALPKVVPPPLSDGVVLPWLQWETSNDLHASPCTVKTQDASTACSTSNPTMSSRGSWSPGDHDSSAGSKDGLLPRFDEAATHRSSCLDNNRSKSFHMDDYLHLQRSEDLLFERLKQKQRIDYGGLTLCGRPTIM